MPAGSGIIKDMGAVDENKNKTKVPQIAGFDKGPKDFFRGSRGFLKKQLGFGGPPKKDFMGFRRGSK
jgi:hypothetical protein